MEAFGYINKLRVEQGLYPLEWSDWLYNKSIERGKDMYERDYFDHTTPEGYDLSMLYISENLAKGLGYYSREYLIKNYSHFYAIIINILYRKLAFLFEKFYNNNQKRLQ